MAGKPRKEGVYSIKELSPEARERVLDKWRYEIWDYHDSDQLSADFKEILSERGFSNPEVGWSLNSCQGDGVAFWGNLDVRDFFTWVFSGDKKAKPFSKDARKFVLLQDAVSVKVTHEGNYYHSNSMDVEVEFTGEPLDLIPHKHRNEVKDFARQKERLYDEWDRLKRNIEYERNKPIREWEKWFSERARNAPRGPKEWRPGAGILRPKPPPLDIPIPPEPEVQMPIRLQRLMAEAESTFNGIDPLLDEFQEFLKGWVENTSSELEKIGYDEMEYRQSDEQIEEFLDGNGYEFDEDGDEL